MNSRLLSIHSSLKVSILLIFDTCKNSTESEKSEEKLNIPITTLETSHKRLRSNSNLAKTFSCNVEDMTKNQLDQIKEIVKGKIDKDNCNISRKNSERQ